MKTLAIHSDFDIKFSGIRVLGFRVLGFLVLGSGKFKLYAGI